VKVIKLNNKDVILKVENLKQYFRSGSGKNRIVVKAVDDITFDIYRGEVFSLVGESGCGKTTTGRTIIKLYPSTGGQVFFEDTRIISDVKAAKEVYKATMKQLNADKKESLDSLKLRQSSNEISDSDYKLEVEKTNETYSAVKASAYKEYHDAKRDRNFERVVDADARREGQEFNSESPAYKEIQAKYTKKNSDLDQEIEEMTSTLKNLTEKVALKEAKAKLAYLKKDRSLNKVREKQDIQRYKYDLINRNRLLMRKMQMIFQDPIASLNPRMTVKEIIAEGLRINGMKNEEEIDIRVKEALTTVGLVAEHAGRYPHEFSGGQRQRIGIARALVVEPTFIIADEPISALDVSIRAQVINLLNDLREEQGITIMFIAHDLSVVKYFSDRVAVMYYGKIVEMGDKDKIFNHPFHPYTLSLIDSIPLPDPVYEKARGKLSRYNPMQEHDYSVESPTLREVEPDHFVLCNTEEFERYSSKLDK